MHIVIAAAGPVTVDTPPWVRDAVFYQIFPDRFATSGLQVEAPGWAAPEHCLLVTDDNWPALVARIAQPMLLLRAPGSFGPTGSPPILLRADAERTAAMMADCRLVDGIGNHLTFVFGDGARVLTTAIAGFLDGAAA